MNQKGERGMFEYAQKVAAEKPKAEVGKAKGRLVKFSRKRLPQILLREISQAKGNPNAKPAKETNVEIFKEKTSAFIISDKEPESETSETIEE